MDFNFSVNAIFRDKLSKVGNNLVPYGYVPDRRGDGDVVTKVSAILDKMGVVSAKAQNLPSPITSATKLRNSDHVVYILTEPEGNRGHGSIVGILKVGHKKLFIYNSNGVQWEMMPLCVLDFYVHESKQRAGFGKMLLDFMLQDQNVKPDHLALDQPSESFLSFMCKHYGLDSIIPQTYSFVVYDTFFRERSDSSRCTPSANDSTESNSKLSQRMMKPSNQCVKATGRSGDGIPGPAYGRHSAKKAGSTMAEYMQDGSGVTSNGPRQGSHCNNHGTSYPETNILSDVSGRASARSGQGDQGGRNPHPTSLAADPGSLSSVDQSAELVMNSSHTQQHDIYVASNGKDVNDSGVTTPDDAVDPSQSHPEGRDRGYSTCHLPPHSGSKPRSADRMAPNIFEHSKEPSTKMIMKHQEDTQGDNTYINGEMFASKTRKISNIPMGEERGEDDVFSPEIVEAVNFKQNGNRHTFGSDGVKDVRIKKTNFTNLSPFRKW